MVLQCRLRATAGVVSPNSRPKGESGCCRTGRRDSSYQSEPELLSSSVGLAGGFTVPSAPEPPPPQMVPCGFRLAVAGDRTPITALPNSAMVHTGSLHSADLTNVTQQRQGTRCLPAVMSKAAVLMSRTVNWMLVWGRKGPIFSPRQLRASVVGQLLLSNIFWFYVYEALYFGS
jgi:hypothetical protein